jgi:hypothetical protein
MKGSPEIQALAAGRQVLDEVYYPDFFHLAF